MALGAALATTGAAPAAAGAGPPLARAPIAAHGPVEARPGAAPTSGSTDVMFDVVPASPTRGPTARPSPSNGPLPVTGTGRQALLALASGVLLTGAGVAFVAIGVRRRPTRLR
ncbi:hypothetical protein [Micromonospora sp. WMMD980]|uniref:hypothetical protein n=1 Tax=Micromonospora sp. WMMD980 TaxID=3016088 RepID=UPI002415E890|nr:hypothetical protein [Micromonospora sp. WMMD980]MDG4800035.1 hypothetical protein [Micromonospora sp. WMMD980]